MADYFETFRYFSDSTADPAFTITRGKIRLSLLAPALLRVECSENESFCDEPTQAVRFRRFDAPKFEKRENGSEVTIVTDKAEFTYSFAAKKMVKIKLADGRTVTDYKKGNLRGTCRTLDRTNGSAKLGDGIVSKNGVALLDDSQTLILTDDGHFRRRSTNGSDVYFFAHGYDYRSAVRDFFRLTGSPTLIPRFAFGNWWSRYKAYTQEEYLTLMERFRAEKIPVTVATVDMDWHWVDVTKRFGSESRNKGKHENAWAMFYDMVSPGWTGYSWNTELFPDHKAFLNKLHEYNLKVTLNLHPSSGARFFEDSYKPFCEFMGLDPEKKEQITFDITDDKFIEGYFRFLHHPHEEEGVNFWWIDWQQGEKTSVPGLDPLWALNHYHFLDSARGGRRPLILSRFAGAGSHRYPLGFSGDTAQTWASLAFQPYFTANATNIGYTWWSHDIGGHHFGIRDDELYLRWVQFGVFSPVNRLHSTSNEFMGKEPWKYRSGVRTIASDCLRFRHRLIPYIYTGNRRTQSEGRALIEPMYYAHPQEAGAYTVPNEYNFGSELTVCPITEKMNKHTNLASTKVWLPEGRFTDIFTNRIYNGGHSFEMFRDEVSIPVLAHEGSIVPLSVHTETNDCSNPDEMEILIFRGCGEFKLYEDDGETRAFENGAFAQTDFAVNEYGKDLCFTISKAEGDFSVLPQKRLYKLSFRDVSDAKSLEIKVDGKNTPAQMSRENGFVSVVLSDILPENEVTVKLFDITARTSGDKKEYLIELFSRLQGKNTPKAIKYTGFVLKGSAAKIPSALKGAVKELEYLY